MKQWEYKSHTVPPEKGLDKLYDFNREFEAVLNEEGASGWELVSVTVLLGGINTVYKREKSVTNALLNNG